MNKYILTLLLLPLLWLVVAACGTQTVTQKAKQEDVTVAEEEEDETMIAMGSGLRIQVWAEAQSSQGEIYRVKIIEDNHILQKAMNKASKATVPLNSIVIFGIDLTDLKSAKPPDSITWTIKTGTEERLSQWGYIDDSKNVTERFGANFSEDFEIAFTLKHEDEVLFHEIVGFSIAASPSIKIVRPTNDIIAEYGEKIRFIANALDGAGNIPLVVWTVKSNQVERIMGIGAEIETDRLDMGYSTISAHAIDFMGNTMVSPVVNVMIPYKAHETRIVIPGDGQMFSWDESVSFFARGNELEYALFGPDDPPGSVKFKKGSGFVKTSLPAGEYRVIFRGKFGEATHRFSVKQSRSYVAQLARVKGKVLMSGKRGVWESIQAGDRIPEGYIVRVAHDGMAEIHLNNRVVFILNRGRAVRIMPNGKVVKNISKEDLALYSLVDPDSISEVEKNLAPMISQLRKLLRNYKIVELESENKEDILRLLDLIFKGQLKIEEVSVE